MVNNGIKYIRTVHSINFLLNKKKYIYKKYIKKTLKKFIIFDIILTNKCCN